MGDAIWTNLVGKPEADQAMLRPSKQPRRARPLTRSWKQASYKFTEAGMNVEVLMLDGKLMLTVPGQPQYTLENVGGRRYKLTTPIAPELDGFFVTFRPNKEKADETEVYLEQPHGNYVLPRLKAEAKAAEPVATETAPLKDFIGSYRLKDGQTVVEVTDKDGKISLVVPGQPAYALEAKAKGAFALTGLPDTYWMNYRRDASGRHLRHPCHAARRRLYLRA